MVVLQVLREFAGDTSIHGFTFLVRPTSSPLTKVIWALAIVVALMYASAEMRNSVISKYHYNLSTNNYYKINLLKFESPFLSILPIYSIMTCWSWKFQSQCYLLYLSFGLISFHCSIKWPSNNFLLSRCNGSKQCKAFGQEIDVKNQKLTSNLHLQVGLRIP